MQLSFLLTKTAAGWLVLPLLSDISAQYKTFYSYDLTLRALMSNCSG